MTARRLRRPPTNREWVRTLRLQGVPAREIALALGLSRMTVYGYMRELRKAGELRRPF